MRVSKRLETIGDHFASLVEEYCHLIDLHKKYSVIPFLIRVERILSQLHADAARLPIVDLSAKGMSKRLNESLKLNENSKSKAKSGLSPFHKREQRLSKYLGKYNSYWQIYDPTDESDSEPTPLFISSDLAEIYEDISDYLDDWKEGNGNQKTAAIHLWQSGWNGNWANHTLKSLSAIHTILDKYFVDHVMMEKKRRNEA